MKRLGRALLAVALVLSILLVLGALAVYTSAQRALPTLSGALAVPGLRAPVEVIRDGTGVPHIYADNQEDLFFAQGYVTAQDRLWQMEFSRRLVWGRLSEVFGPATLEADRVFRTMGLGRAALEQEGQLDAESSLVLRAYADGVNAYVSGRDGALPLEFSLLLLGFEPWRPVDSLAWSKMMAWQLSANSGAELLRAALVGKFGADGAAALMPSVPAGVVPQTTPALDYANLGVSVRQRLDRVVNLVRPPSDELGSNNWVVAGSRSASGSPLLANDTHLGLQQPPVWYQVHLVGAGFDVVGFSLPGTPGVIVGHNRDIAWGMTNVGADVQDFFVERRHPDYPNRFLFQGQWEEARLVREEVVVRGWREPLRLEIPSTRHGPVLNADVPDEEPIALGWTALRSARLPASVLSLDRAKDWQEFRQALRDFDVPSQHFVYADVAGNIGYQMPGLIPRRANGDGLLPVPGWTGEYEWQGYIPFDELPSAFNPPAGLLASANNRVVEDGYPGLITHEWAPPFRVERIRQLLSGEENLTLEGMAAIQNDQVSLFARWLAPRVGELGGRGLAGEWGEPTPRARAAVALLAGWDGTLAAESPAAALYAVFYSRLVVNVFADDLGPDLFRYYLPASRAHILAVMGFLDDEESAWFDDRRTPARERRGEIVWRSLTQAADALGRRFGDDPARWRWGELHTATFAHPLSQAPFLDRLLNRGPYPRGGDGTTVNVSGYSFLSPYRETHQPAMRVIFDLADWDRALAVVTTGQSGQPFSRHYDDYLPLWLAGEYAPLPYSRQAVEKAQSARLVLQPAL